MRDPHRLDLVPKAIHGLLAPPEAFVSRELLGRGTEKALVVLDGLRRELRVRDLLLHDVVLGDELLLGLREEDRVPELDRLVPAAALDELDVVLEDAEDPLRRGHHLSLEPRPRGGSKDLPHLLQVVSDLRSQGPDLQVRDIGRKRDEVLATPDDPLDLREVLLPLPMDLLLALRARARGVARDEEVELLDLPVVEAVLEELCPS